jgi:acetyl esterase/lipase
MVIAHRYRLAFLLVAFAFALLTACSGDEPPPSSTPTGPTPTPPAAAARVDTGVTYCVRDDVALKMDVYYPQDQPERAPAVLFMHAGAWVLGDKTVIGDDSQFDELLARGFVVASIDYRLAPQHPFPAQIEDAKCAVRHLRAEADTYGIDGERIAAWGASAGGHLAALLGVTGPDAGFEGAGGSEGEASDVQAVVTMFGPADLEAPDFVSIAETAARDVFGVGEAGESDVLHRASPVNYVSAEDPPFLIIHGERDSVVPVNQAVALHAKLQAAGARSTLVLVKNAEHGFESIGGPVTPSIGEIRTLVADFLNLVLTRDPAVRGQS